MNIRIAWLLLILLAFAGPAAALDITVTRFDDPSPTACAPSDCSLREAVILTNNLAGADRILCRVFWFSPFPGDTTPTRTPP